MYGINSDEYLEEQVGKEYYNKHDKQLNTKRNKLKK